MQERQKQESEYDKMQSSSYLDGNSAGYIEALYEDFLVDPLSVPTGWHQYFSSLNVGATT